MKENSTSRASLFLLWTCGASPAHCVGGPTGHLHHSARSASVWHRSRTIIRPTRHPVRDCRNARVDIDRPLWRSQHVANRSCDRGYRGRTAGSDFECLAVISDEHRHELGHCDHAAGDGGGGARLDFRAGHVWNSHLYERPDDRSHHSRHYNASARIAPSQCFRSYCPISEAGDWHWDGPFHWSAPLFLLRSCIHIRPRMPSSATRCVGFRNGIAGSIGASD